jgi:hypothetical protein
VKLYFNQEPFDPFVLTSARDNLVCADYDGIHNHRKLKARSQDPTTGVTQEAVEQCHPSPTCFVF